MVQATQAKQVSSSAFPGFKQFLTKQEEEASKYYNMAEEYQKEIKKSLEACSSSWGKR